MTDGAGVSPRPTCTAPSAALRFSPDGAVHVCKVNDRWELGRINEGLSGLWAGERIVTLRSALARGDFSLGCQECGSLVQGGHRAAAHAVEYDRFAPAADPPVLRRVEFALSNTCNLQCVMCDGNLSSAIRSRREGRAPLRPQYGDSFFDEMRGLLDEIEVAVFIGGEPFLMRECRRMWDMMLEAGYAGEVHVTTNGTVWDERVEHYVRDLRMHVAVSIDALTPPVFEAIRVGADFAEVMRNRDRFHEATVRSGSSFMLNHCTMTGNWQELGPFLVDAEERSMRVHVLLVTSPARYSLQLLPTDELARIVDALDAEDERIGHSLMLNREVWDDTRRRLRAYHARRLPREAVPVGVTVRGPGEQDLADDRGRLDQRDAREQLESWSGRPALQIEATAGIVDAAVVPDWAAGVMSADGLAGSAAELALDHVVKALGPPGSIRSSVWRPGVSEFEVVFGRSDELVTVRSFLGEWTDSAGVPRSWVVAASDRDLVVRR